MCIRDRYQRRVHGEIIEVSKMEDGKTDNKQAIFKVKVSDMEEKLQLKSTGTIQNAFERYSKLSDIANEIRSRMESDENGVWNCVIGKSFGSHVLHLTKNYLFGKIYNCLLYTSPSPRDLSTSRMPSSA
eukprot:TRINITY_DN1427_c0_g2_i3.p1 TRINITY_DN1427_c0_g2~~TRINITY_DN1427_c0_g2_i3.p1  ORF type:complete len:129 (-),score=29.52 TRINITY_DN1427_c0_g2_i3:23-409(-)